MIEYVIPALLNLPTNKTATETSLKANWSNFSSSLLIEVSRDQKIFTSSAVLIRRNVLLTAAHSVQDIEKGYVHLSHKYGQDNMRIGFKKVIIHSGYDKSKSNFKDDIALIILDSNLPKSFKPTSLDLSSDIQNIEVDRIGFGGRNGLNTRTWTNPLAKETVDNTIVLKDELSVIGDSGGPIYSKNGLVGIHSTLEGNDKTYAVYVPAYKNWIDSYLPIKEVLN
jgi:V8-like Glu-specific endopeptidase